MQATIEAIVDVGIPVMGHVGLTPQSVHRFGGYKIQGKRKSGSGEIGHGRCFGAVEEAGAFAVVLEGMPLDLAKEITERLTIPTIGIGAGVTATVRCWWSTTCSGCSMISRRSFVKRYADIKEVMTGAVKSFIADVRERKFPGEEHSFINGVNGDGVWRMGRASLVGPLLHIQLLSGPCRSLSAFRDAALERGDTADGADRFCSDHGFSSRRAL